MKLVMNMLVLVGLAIALIGIGVDFLLPRASPGFGLPQLLLVGAGLALALAAALLRHDDHRRRLFVALKGKIFTASVITLLTLLALEIVLTVFGMPTYFPLELPDTEFQVISWKTCDENGCRLTYEAITAACAAGELSGRTCIVNRQGYPNSKDFVLREEYDERFRIVAVGDSFTQGSTADVGKSFVGYLDAALPATEIWNLGIGGTGTVHGLQAYTEYAPSFRPRLSILGFTMNDFRDNQQLNFIGIQLRDSEGNIHFPRYPQKDRWGNPIHLTQEFVLSYAAVGYMPPMSDLEALVGSTRLGTLALRILDRIASIISDRPFEGQAEITRRYLSQLRDAALALDSSFLVLLIPRLEDIEDPGQEFAHSIKLMEELGIHYLNPISLLKTDDYVPAPDRHWNNSGHQKVGALLRACIEILIDGGNLGECEYVVMP